MASSNDDEKVNVVRLLERLGLAVDHWTVGQLRGRMLKCGHREARILGSRLAPVPNEQTQIPV